MPAFLSQCKKGKNYRADEATACIDEEETYGEFINKHPLSFKIQLIPARYNRYIERYFSDFQLVTKRKKSSIKFKF